VNVDEKSLSFRDWKISDPSSVPLSQNATIPGLVVRSGFLDIYPGQTVPAHLQNLVSGYATYQELTTPSF